MKILVAALVVATGFACSSVGGPPGTNQTLPTGSFVGRVSGSDAFVAVELADGEGDAVAVTAYVTNGSSLFEWFEGDATTQQPQFFSVGGVDGASATGGATLSLDLDKEGLLGTLFTADGMATLDLQADPAEGVAGLYHFTIDDDGGLTGATSGGATVEGTYSQESETGAWTLSATFTPAPGEGAAQEILTSVEDGAEAGNGLLVVLADLQVRGAGGSPPGPIAPGLDRR